MSDTVIAQSRAHLAAAQADYFQRHAQRIAAVQQDQPAPCLPPLALQITVGLGKSHSVGETAVACWQSGLPLAVLVPTHQLADEYIQRFSELRVHATHYYGRQSPGNAIGDAWTCWKQEAVEQAGARNHRPAQSLCKTCAHGMRVEAERGKEQAIEFFKRRGERPDDYEPCRFLYDALPAMLDAQLLVLPISSFSEAVGFWQPRDLVSGIPDERVQRLIIVDEHIDLARPVQIRAGDVAGWRDALPALGERLGKTVDALQRKGELKSEATDLQHARDLRMLLPDLDSLFSDVAGRIAGDVQPDAMRVLDVYKRARKAGAFRTAGTAPWEKVALRDDGGFHIPLRALRTLATNIEAGTLRTARNHWVAHELSPVVEWAQKHGSTVFMDATLPLPLRAIVEATGGQIIEASAPQNHRIQRVTGHLYARGMVGPGEYQRNAKSRLRELERIAEQLPRPAALLTHKSTLRYSQDACDHPGAAQNAAAGFEERTGVAIGWFGAHDRGHNRWSGRALALVGMPLLPPEAIASSYGTDRAALAQAGIDWPAWSGAMTDPADTTTSPQGVPLPSTSHVREWLLDRYAAGIAQGIGRNRAVNHHNGTPLLVQLWGGIDHPDLDKALERFGITIHERSINFIHTSLQGYRARGTDMNKIDEAIVAAQAAAQETGKPVGKALVRRMLTRMNATAADATITARLREIESNPSSNPSISCGRDAEIPSRKRVVMTCEAWDEAFEERAGILQFDAGLSRTVAEAAAREIVTNELGPRPRPTTTEAQSIDFAHASA